MTAINNPLPEKRATPERFDEHEEVAEYEESWTLVPDDLAESGWAVLFEDGSFTRSWIPGLV